MLFKPYTREIKAFFDWVPYHLLQRPLPGNHEETHAHLETGHTQSRRCLPAVKIYFIYIYIYGNGDIFCDKIAGVQRHGAIFAPNLPLDQDLVLKTPMVTTGDPS